MFILVAVFALGTLLVGCDEEAGEGSVDIAYVNWADNVAVTYLAQAVLEEEMGYDVNVTMADAGAIYEDIAGGDHDVFLATWLPVTHQDYWEQHGDNIDQIGPNFTDAKIGLVVPEYVEIDSIEEMGEYIDDFDGQLIGIDPGAGIMQAAGSALEAYDSLADYELLDSSDVGMTSELSQAVENEEWIAVTGWIPHWKFARYDLKFLEDPEGVFGEAENVYNVGRMGLADDMPEVREFFENFYLDDEKLHELMVMIEETGDEQGSAREWMEDNMDIVENWLP